MRDRGTIRDCPPFRLGQVQPFAPPSCPNLRQPPSIDAQPRQLRNLLCPRLRLLGFSVFDRLRTCAYELSEVTHADSEPRLPICGTARRTLTESTLPVKSPQRPILRPYGEEDS